MECAQCGSTYEMGHWGPCSCGGTLLVQYRFDQVSQGDLLERGDLWRYLPLLPVPQRSVVSLGEGATPLRRLRGGGEVVPGAVTYIKDESLSPTATFKARGMTVAVSMARELGHERLAVPSAGNAGVALAAYAAAAGLEALVVAPQDTPAILLREIMARGAKCLLVRGLLEEAGSCVEEASKAGYTNLATLREPYRVEGKKTMGFEVWEQLGRVPDWIVFPTGGGTGVIGLWKAFGELGKLGWSDARMPRICAVQSTGCPPLAEAWQTEAQDVPSISDPRTVAVGLRVSKPAGLHLIMRAIRESRGLVIAVSEEDIPRAASELGIKEGIYPCYEGAVAYLGLQALAREGHIERGDRVVLFNTGMGLINPGTEMPTIPTLETPREILSYLGD
ncbi:MAG: threonine synthase [Thermoplasmata archaeon]